MKMTRNKVLTYSELIQIPTFEGRIEYLRLGAMIGEDTFGPQRYINQAFYTSTIWKRLRSQIIVRDNGCDLAFPNQEIFGRAIIHHLNPITEDDIIEQTPYLLDPEFLVLTSEFTHNFIHFGVGDFPQREYVPRFSGDTKMW